MLHYNNLSKIKEYAEVPYYSTIVVLVRDINSEKGERGRVIYYLFIYYIFILFRVSIVHTNCLFVCVYG